MLQEESYPLYMLRLLRAYRLQEDTETAAEIGKSQGTVRRLGTSERKTIVTARLPRQKMRDIFENTTE